MKPSQVRERVLDDHMELRDLIEAVEALSDAFEKGGDASGIALREHATALYEVFAAHLSLEDAFLIPALREIPEAGAAMADRLEREHREQRELILYLLGRLQQQERPTSLVANEVRSFAEYLRSDMMHEEATILNESLLRD